MWLALAFKSWLWHLYRNCKSNHLFSSSNESICKIYNVSRWQLSHCEPSTEEPREPRRDSYSSSRFQKWKHSIMKTLQKTEWLYPVTWRTPHSLTHGTDFGSKIFFSYHCYPPIPTSNPRGWINCAFSSSFNKRVWTVTLECMFYTKTCFHPRLLVSLLCLQDQLRRDYTKPIRVRNEILKISRVIYGTPSFETILSRWLILKFVFAHFFYSGKITSKNDLLSWMTWTLPCSCVLLALFEIEFLIVFRSNLSFPSIIASQNRNFIQSLQN